MTVARDEPPPMDVGLLAALEAEAEEHDPPGSSTSWRSATDDERPIRLRDAAAWRSGLSASVERAGYRSPDEYLGAVSAKPPEPSGRKQALPFSSAAALVAEAPVEVEWTWLGYLARGCVEEMIAPAKVGKTTLLLLLCAALVDGRPFLDRPTVRTPVVILTEQPPSSFVRALERAGLTERSDVRVLLWSRARSVPWPDVVAAAVAECRAFGAHVLVVDALPAWAGLRGDAENDAGSAAQAMEPLQVAAAEHNLSVVVVRHTRKGGAADLAEAGRGSSAFSGAVDVVLRLARKDGASRPTIRVLSAVSRFDETPAELVIERTDDGYTVLGDEIDYETGRARDAIREALEDSPDGLTMRELVEQTDMPRATLQLALVQLVDRDGVVERTGRGIEGDPRRFRAVRDSFRQRVPPTGETLTLAERDPRTGISAVSQLRSGPSPRSTPTDRRTGRVSLEWRHAP